MLNLLGIPHADEARRKMTELVHDKVVTALGQQCQWGVKAGTEQSAELPPVELQDLIAEQRAYRRVGFTSEVFELQHAINNKRAEGQGDKAEEDDKLTKQRLMAMEMRQNKRAAELQQSQQAETEKLIDAQMRDYQQLLERQADEMHQLVENVTAMMTIGASWTPVVQGSPDQGGSLSWAVQLKKHRFRPSRDLAALTSNVSKLGEVHAGASILRELQQKAEGLERHEREVWRKQTMRVILGSDRGSLASQLVAGHKVAQEKIKDHHRQRMRILYKVHDRARTTLEGQFRCARAQRHPRLHPRQPLPPPYSTQAREAERHRRGEDASQEGDAARVGGGDGFGRLPKEAALGRCSLPRRHGGKHPQQQQRPVHARRLHGKVDARPPRREHLGGPVELWACCSESGTHHAAVRWRNG